MKKSTALNPQYFITGWLEVMNDNESLKQEEDLV
jgi:hypothetical protein